MRKLKYKLSLSPVDYFILLMLVIGGIYGFAKFPDFISLEDAKKLSYPAVEIVFFMAFNLALIYKIVNRAYFTNFSAIAASLIFLFVIFAVTYFLLTLLVVRSSLDTWRLLALLSASGDCFLLLTVQSWFKPTVDLKKVEELRGDLAEIVVYIRSSDAKSFDGAIFDNFKLLKKTFESSADSAIIAKVLDEKSRSEVSTIRSLLDQIDDAIDNVPQANLSADLGKLDIAALSRSL